MGRSSFVEHRRRCLSPGTFLDASLEKVDDLDDAVARAAELDAEIVMPLHRNPPEGEPGGPAHRELWLRDLDGYTVVLASPDGESPL